MDASVIAQTQAAFAAARTVPTPGHTADIVKARKAAQELEGVFLGQMLKPMFESIDVEEPFSGGPGEDMWRSLQVDEYGKALARAGGIGLADAVVAEMLKTQEVQ